MGEKRQALHKKTHRTHQRWAVGRTGKGEPEGDKLAAKEGKGTKSWVQFPELCNLGTGAHSCNPSIQRWSQRNPQTHSKFKACLGRWGRERRGRGRELSQRKAHMREKGSHQLPARALGPRHMTEDIGTWQSLSSDDRTGQNRSQWVCADACCTHSAYIYYVSFSSKLATTSLCADMDIYGFHFKEHVPGWLY